MNREQAKELLENPVFRAFVEGKEIEYKNSEGEWYPVSFIAENDFLANHRLRIKEDSKTECWAIIFKNGGRQYFSTEENLLAYKKHNKTYLQIREVKKIVHLKEFQELPIE